MGKYLKIGAIPAVVITGWVLLNAGGRELPVDLPEGAKHVLQFSIDKRTGFECSGCDPKSQKRVAQIEQALLDFDCGHGAQFYIHETEGWVVENQCDGPDSRQPLDNATINKLLAKVR